MNATTGVRETTGVRTHPGALGGIVRSPLLVLVAGLYLTAFPYHPGLRSPNELCRLWQARALVEFRSLDLNQTLRTYGYVGDLSVKDGRYYPSKAPLLSFLAAPLYAALKWFGGSGRHAVPEIAQVFWSRLFLTVLPTLALLALLRRFLSSYLPRSTTEALLATYALGSLAFSYSLLFMSHQLTAVLLFAGFFALWRCGRREWRERGYIVAGAAAGAAVAAEYTAALGVAGLVLYAAFHVLSDRAESRRARLVRLARAAGLATLGGLPFVLLLMAYHQACFGHPLESGYKYLADAAYQPWHLGGFLGIRFPDPRAFALSFFSPLRGLFTLSPFLLLALPGLSPLRRAERVPTHDRRSLFWSCVALLLGYAYFTSSFSYESWGWTTGPRHMTGLVPFLLLPAGLFIERLHPSDSLKGRIGLGLAAGACAASIAVTGPVSLVNYIPDSVSSPLFGLAVPLFREGFLPPSALSLLGLPNPAAGLPLLLGIGIAAGWVVVKLVRPLPPQERISPAVTAAFTLGAFLLLMSALAQGGANDLGAQGHLRSVWLTPPGKVLQVWPEGPR